MFFCRYSWWCLFWKKLLPPEDTLWGKTKAYSKIKLTQSGNRNPPHISLFKENRPDVKNENFLLSTWKSAPSQALIWNDYATNPYSQLEPSRILLVIYRQYVNINETQWMEPTPILKLHNQLWVHQKAFLAADSTYESRRCFGNEKHRERSKEVKNSNSRFGDLLV